MLYMWERRPLGWTDSLKCMKLSSTVCVTEQKDANTGNIQTEFIEHKASNWIADQYGDTGWQCGDSAYLLHMEWRPVNRMAESRSDVADWRRTEDLTVRDGINR